MMDDDSGDSEEDEGEEDWLRQGWRSETGSLFQRWGDTCRNERFVIFNEELDGGEYSGALALWAPERPNVKN